LRERWFGATGRRVPEIALEGDPAVPVDEALVLDYPADLERLREAHTQGIPVVVRAESPKGVKGALARPEVAAVLVPPSAEDLLTLDLTDLTYGP
jgi:hypothetical protein